MSIVDDVNEVAESAASATRLAILLIANAEMLGLMRSSGDGHVDAGDVSNALRAFAAAGVGRSSAAVAASAQPADVARAIAEVLAALDDSPLPELEWPPMCELLGDSLLEQLLGVSASSIQRYRSGTRPTPDGVALRLHTIALTVADLAGSYNDFGIRRWFSRARAALGGRSPADVLHDTWDPDDDAVRQVRALARALLA